MLCHILCRLAHRPGVLVKHYLFGVPRGTLNTLIINPLSTCKDTKKNRHLQEKLGLLLVIMSGVLFSFSVVIDLYFGQIILFFGGEDAASSAAISADLRWLLLFCSSPYGRPAHPPGRAGFRPPSLLLSLLASLRSPVCPLRVTSPLLGLPVRSALVLAINRPFRSFFAHLAVK